MKTTATVTALALTAILAFTAASAQAALIFSDDFQSHTANQSVPTGGSDWTSNTEEGTVNNKGRDTSTGRCHSAGPARSGSV